MKELTSKLIILILISTIILNSCVSDNEIEQKITKGYWVENISKKDFIESTKRGLLDKDINITEFNTFIENLPESVEHYLVFENNRFKEYITFKKDNLKLIADCPASIHENTLTLYHPDNSGKVISTLQISKDLVFLNHNISQSMQFNFAEFNKTNVSAKLSLPECLAACYITHLHLKLSFLDDICCFWY